MQALLNPDIGLGENLGDHVRLAHVRYRAKEPYTIPKFLRPLIRRTAVQSREYRGRNQWCRQVLTG